MFVILIIRLMTGPAVSLTGRRRYRRQSSALGRLPPNPPASMYFFALSQAPPPGVIEGEEEVDDGLGNEQAAQRMRKIARRTGEARSSRRAAAFFAERPVTMSTRRVVRHCASMMPGCSRTDAGPPPRPSRRRGRPLHRERGEQEQQQPPRRGRTARGVEEAEDDRVPELGRVVVNRRTARWPPARRADRVALGDRLRRVADGVEPSVTWRTDSGSSAISAIPPALSVSARRNRLRGNPAVPSIPWRRRRSRRCRSRRRPRANSADDAAHVANAGSAVASIPEPNP